MILSGKPVQQGKVWNKTAASNVWSSFNISNKTVWFYYPIHIYKTITSNNLLRVDSYITLKMITTCTIFWNNLSVKCLFLSNIEMLQLSHFKWFTYFLKVKKLKNKIKLITCAYAFSYWSFTTEMLNSDDMTVYRCFISIKNVCVCLIEVYSLSMLVDV